MRRVVVLPRSSRCLGRPSVARRPAAVKCCFMSARSSLALGTQCPYKTLGVGYDADEEAIKVAFRRKAKQMHPDVSGDPISAIAFMECQNAYQFLLDPERRATYDKTLLPRANSQVLSYLNARSAARHGIPVSRVPSRGTYSERPEHLYTTMLELLDQVKSCAKHLEREIVGKEGVLRGLGTAAPAAKQPCRPSSSTGNSATRRPSAATDAECECSEAECCEPWIYYASEPVTEKVTVAPAPRRRR